MEEEGRGVQATVGRDDCKRLASWLKLAMSDKDSRALVNDFPLTFEKRSFDLQCPVLDGSLSRRLKRKLSTAASKALEAEDKALAGVQKKILA